MNAVRGSGLGRAPVGAQYNAAVTSCHACTVVCLAQVNGVFSNPRYVEGAVQGTKDYVANQVNPVLVPLLSEVARCKPSNPTGFMVDLLTTGKTPAPEESKGGEGGYDEVFATLNATMAELMKKLMVEQVRVARRRAAASRSHGLMMPCAKPASPTTRCVHGASRRSLPMLRATSQRICKGAPRDRRLGRAEAKVFVRCKVPHMHVHVHAGTAEHMCMLLRLACPSSHCCCKRTVHVPTTTGATHTRRCRC